MKELVVIQNGLKAPKSQWNKFGNYSFRSAEDILESVKPLLAENNCTLIVADEVVLIGERYYVKATATIKNATGETVFANAYAREEEAQKGMASAQITGSASSYARKYALNGLLCIDDTKDPDSTNTHEKKEPDAKKSPSNKPPIVDLEERFKLAKESAKKAKSRKDFVEIWKTYPDLHGMEKFVKFIQDATEKLPKDAT